jgi:hypothetical protein
MMCQLVLQYSGTTMSDFDHLVELEDVLEEELGPWAEVDGHDFGRGEMNIFLLTEHPVRTFELAMSLLERIGSLSGLRAGYREVEGEGYTALWPVGLDHFTVT